MGKGVTDIRNSKCKGPAVGACLVRTTTRGSTGWSRVNKGESGEYDIKEVTGAPLCLTMQELGCLLGDKLL